MNLGALIATLGVDTAGLRMATAEMRRFEARASASIASVNAKLAASGAMMKKFGRSMSMYVTAPLALVGGAAAKMHMGFESSMTKIVGLVGVAREQVDAWGQDILRIAPSLGKAPKELADALYFITSAGIRGAEAMDVLVMSAKASAVGLGETKIVADLVTSAMNAYGKEVLNAEAATDVLTATVREGKAEADALAGSMGMVLPIASAMGVQFHEVGGAVAAMTRTGTNAQTASMQLRQILASLVKPAQQAEKAMWAMGTSSAALRKTIREDGLLAALMKIRELTNKYGEDTMAKVFPNIRALSGVLDIMGENMKDNEAIMERMGLTAGSTGNAFKETAKTFEFKWKVAVSSATTALTVLGKTIAEQLIPILKGFTERMQRLVMWFDNLNERQKTTVIRVAALIAVIGPLSMALGWLVGSVIPGLIKVGFLAVKMFNILRIAMLANPITAIAMGIVAVAAALGMFGKSAEGAAVSQGKLNKTMEDYNRLLAAGLKLKESTQSIEDRMKMINKLNERQVNDLKQSIEERIRLEEDYSIKLAEELRSKLEEEKKYAAMMASGKEAEMAQAREWLGKTAAGWKRGLFLQGQYNQDRLALLETYRVEAERISKLLGGDDEDGGAVEGLREREAVMKTLAEEIEFARGMEKALGEQFDETTFLIQANMKAIQGLIALGVDPLGQQVTDLVTKLRVLQEGLEGAGEGYTNLATGIGLTKVNIDGMNAAMEQGVVVSERLAQAEMSIGLAAGILSGAFRGMSNVISNALNETENVLQAFGKFFMDFIKGLIIKMVAAAVAALALAVVLSFILPGFNVSKIFSGLEKGAKFGKIFGAGLKSFAGMQRGGIVPPGYPSDSYPALLTSGEAVIPPGELKKQMVEVRLSGEFELDGVKMKYLVDRGAEIIEQTT